MLSGAVVSYPQSGIEYRGKVYDEAHVQVMAVHATNNNSSLVLEADATLVRHELSTRG